MSFLVRKAQVRPTISWPVERPVESQREPIPLRSTLTSTTPSSPTSFKSSHTSNHSISTAATATSIPNSLQCEFDQDAYFAEFPDSIDISDDFPDNEAVAEAGEVLIYDSDGNERPFKSIYSGDPIGEQQLVIFVRHFFCGACQAYLRALSKAITLQTYFTLPVPTSITIIGLGSPNLIPSYRRISNCPFPIYADPTRQLYKALGMSWTLRPGPKCEYMKDTNEFQWVKGQVKQLKEEDKSLRLKGGNLLWVGGEFMFRDGEVVWCKRMKTYRGHSEIDVIQRLLGVED